MLRIALLLVLTMPLGACQLALPIAATQVAVPIATSQTVLRGNKQMVEIRTEPSGATVNIPGYGTRTTPTFIMLARGHSHTVRITKDGFKSVTANLTSQRENADSTPTGLGGALDEVSGAAWELNPDRLTLTLESLTPPTPPTPSIPPATPTANTALASSGAPAANPAEQPKAAPGLTPPTIVQQPPAVAEKTTALAAQIARLDKLLEQGVITRREYEILTAMALAATAVAGAEGSSPP